MAYVFLANHKRTRNRPADEHRLQVRYGDVNDAAWRAQRHPVGFDPAGVDVTLVVGIHPPPPPPRVILRPGKRRAYAADEDAGVMVVIGLAVGGARRGVGEPAGTWAAISFPTKPIAPAPASTQRWDRLCRMDKSIDRLDRGDARADEDRGHDEVTGAVSASPKLWIAVWAMRPLTGSPASRRWRSSSPAARRASASRTLRSKIGWDVADRPRRYA